MHVVSHWKGGLYGTFKLFIYFTYFGEIHHNHEMVRFRLLPLRKI